MKYMIDIDGTICNNTYGEYANAMPFTSRIEHFNRLYDQGHEVHYWTARGANTGLDWADFTKQQLSDWGVKYNTLRMGKPSYDIWIDDKAMEVSRYFLEYA